MRSSILLLSVVLLTVKADIPDYMTVCKRHDPEISQCILNNVNNLRERLAGGIADLDVPALDPLHFDMLAFDLGPGFRAEVKDIELTGASKFEVNNLTVTLDNDEFAFDIQIPGILVKAIYTLDANIASIPLRGNGPITITATGIHGSGILHGKEVSLKGKHLYWFPKLVLKLDVADYSVKLENLFNGDDRLGEVANRLLNENKNEILVSIIPAFEKSLSNSFLATGNNICKHFTFDELFPEQ